MLNQGMTIFSISKKKHKIEDIEHEIGHDIELQGMRSKVDDIKAIW